MNRQPAVVVDAVLLIAANEPSELWTASADQIAEEFESRALLTTELAGVDVLMQAPSARR